MRIHVSKAALTVVRLEDGRRVNVHKGRPVPSSADPADLERLVDEGYLEIIDVADPEAADDDEDEGEDGTVSVEELLKRNIPKILEAVGDNAESAAVVLEAETSEGGKNRAKLIEALKAVIEAAEGNGD